MSKSSKVLWVAWILLLIAWIVNLGTKKDYQESTERQTFVDTIPFYNPVPNDSDVIRHVTAKLPKAESKSPNDVKKSPQDDEILPETHKIGEILCDSAEVEIPITQKIYEQKSFTAYISGYDPKLDSLIIYPKTEVVTVTKCKPPKRWSIGVQAGYGMSRNGMQPYIGIGVSYNLFSF